MPAIANITLVDTSSVSHLFEPKVVDSYRCVWMDDVQTEYIGKYKLTMELVTPKGPSNVANRSMKLKVRIEVPVLETLSTSDTGLTPPPTIAYRDMVETVFTISQRTALLGRQDLLEFVKDSMALAVVTNFIEDMALPY